MLIFRVWPSEKNCNSWIQAEAMFYIIGAVTAAAISGPFMAPKDNLSVLNNSTLSNGTLNIKKQPFQEMMLSSNISNITSILTEEEQQQSSIAIAYGIISAFGILVSLMLIAVDVNIHKTKAKHEENNPSSEIENKLPRV